MDQGVLGDQQLVVELAVLAEVAVGEALALKQGEKQTHPTQAAVVAAVQGLPVELVVLPAFTLVLLQEVPVARELQTLVALAVPDPQARVEDWVLLAGLRQPLVCTSGDQIMERAAVRVVPAQQELVAQQEITGPRDQPGRQAQRDPRGQRVRQGQRDQLARREARYLVMRM